MRNRSRRSYLHAALLVPALLTPLWIPPAPAAADVPEIGWPRAIEAEQAEIVVYQPQLDSLEGDKLAGRAALSTRR